MVILSFVPPKESTDKRSTRYPERITTWQSRASGAVDYEGEEGILDGVIVVKQYHAMSNRDHFLAIAQQRVHKKQTIINKKDRTMLKSHFNSAYCVKKSFYVVQNIYF